MVYLLEIRTPYSNFIRFYTTLTNFESLWRACLRTKGRLPGQLNVDWEEVQQAEGNTVTSVSIDYKRNLRILRKEENLDEWISDPESCFTQ